MVTKEAAQEAIKDPNPMIDGRKANVNLAYLGAKPRNAMLSNAAAAAASKLFVKKYLLNYCKIHNVDSFLFYLYSSFRYSHTFRCCLSRTSNLRVN